MQKDLASYPFPLFSLKHILSGRSMDQKEKAQFSIGLFP